MTSLYPPLVLERRRGKRPTARTRRKRKRGCSAKLRVSLKTTSRPPHRLTSQATAAIPILIRRPGAEVEYLLAREAPSCIGKLVFWSYLFCSCSRISRLWGRLLPQTGYMSGLTSDGLHSSLCLQQLRHWICGWTNRGERRH